MELVGITPSLYRFQVCTSIPSWILGPSRRANGFIFNVLNALSLPLSFRASPFGGLAPIQSLFQTLRAIWNQVSARPSADVPLTKSLLQSIAHAQITDL